MIVFLFLSLAGFIASVAVHASSFSATAPIGMHNAWPLHIGIFLVFLPMALLQQRHRRSGEVSDASRHTPHWMHWISGLCIANAAVSILLVAGGASAHEAHVARCFSGYWMVFYWVSFVGIYDGLSRRREARRSMPRLPALPEALRQRRSYERAPTPRLSPWLHATTGAILSLLCFVALPLSVMLSLGLMVGPSVRQSAGGGWMFLVAPLFFGAAILGFTLPGRLMARYVPAACPMCGGRAYASGAALGTDQGLHYTCHDCGHACGVDGALIE